LRENIGRLTQETSEANKSLVHLKGLEQRADALNTLYQSFLSRYEQALQQQSFPIAKARVISSASTPTGPSSPSKTIVLGLSMVLGLMVGAALATAAEFSERYFRIEADIRSALGLKFLGYLPILPGSLFNRPKVKRGEEPPLLNPGMRVAVDTPGSAYAETLRNAKLAADVVLQGEHSKVIGIISALPREGKTTVAANLAGFIASTGSKTLLIDADLRNPGLARQMVTPPEKGLMDAIAGEESWASFVKVDRRSRLAILPSVARSNFAHTSELLSSAGMAELLRGAREMFDYIVVDLPPSAAVVDAKAFEPEVDGFIVVAEWGATPRTLLRSLLRAEPRMRSKVLGVILNKTDMKKLARYASLGGSERYMNRYADYYVKPSARGRT
jgi:succinoglycan biosynthesis transport protein ExoP